LYEFFGFTMAENYYISYRFFIGVILLGLFLPDICSHSADSWPNHRAITLRSTPWRSSAMAAEWRSVWDVIFLPIRDGQD
jgi:hypothetical protein